MPEVTIDDKKVTVPPETSILEAAKRANVWIPTLCYFQGLSTSGSCRVCLVEVDLGGGRSKLVTSCNYPVRKDITVRVSSERAVKARRGVMELLLARSPGSSELKALAEKMGVKETPYPTVTESQRDCILCGLCVKVCEEAIHCSAIGFTGRGTNRIIATPFRLAAEACIACGACAAVCPVGTIQVRIHEESGEAEISPFKSRVKLLVCQECGKRMVTEPVGAEALRRTGFDWEEFRKRAMLCPDCRRKMAAQSLALVAEKKR